MELKQVKFTSKKNNKEYVGYCLCVGDFQSPMFFPSKIELDYLRQRIQEAE